MRRITDWSQIDWRKHNDVIAAETGAAITTVIKRRTTYGHPADPRPRRRPDNAERNRRPERRKQVAAHQPKATQAAKLSPRAGRGPDNVHAKEWHLIAPDGTEYQVRNLYEFVRNHSALFAPADVEWKRTGGKRGKGGEYCNATAGLLNVRAGKSRAWKGWRLERSPNLAASVLSRIATASQPATSATLGVHVAAGDAEDVG